jgi:hypothetical protein
LTTPTFLIDTPASSPSIVWVKLLRKNHVKNLALQTAKDGALIHSKSLNARGDRTRVDAHTAARYGVGFFAGAGAGAGAAGFGADGVAAAAPLIG